MRKTKNAVNMNPRDPQTKEDAVEFVSAVMSFPLALVSSDFLVAMELSERFDIRAKDILELRKKRAKNK